MTASRRERCGYDGHRPSRRRDGVLAGRRAQALVHARRGLRRRTSAGDFSRPTRPAPGASSTPGATRLKARSRSSSCSINSRATCSADKARAFDTDPLARAAAGRALARGDDRRVDASMRGFFFLPFMHSEDLADQERCRRALPGGQRCRWTEIRAGSRRYHPPLRTLSRTATARLAARPLRKSRPFSMRADFPDNLLSKDQGGVSCAN